MLFRTTEHYSFFENEENFEKECLICFNTIPYTSIIKNTYNFECECYKLIHDTCLQTWYNKNNTCPICRKYIYKKTNYMFGIVKTFIGILLIIETLIKFVAFLYFIYLLIIIYYIFISFIKLLL